MNWFSSNEIGVRTLGCWFSFVLLFLCTPAFANDPTRDHELYFEQHVRPLLAEHCFQCHGPRKQKGKLRLDSLAGMLHGGESGAAVQPNDAEASLLLEAVRYESLEMPPSGKLSDESIQVLATWIDRGAAWPGQHATVTPRSPKPTFTNDDRSYWAFQPVVATSPPATQDEDWAQNPIDQFILAKLEQNSLRPSQPADRRTLIRRVTFDLTGLPPTWQAVEAFVNDESDLAYERLVDRLLLSPEYGEHQARMWLDLVRYAESDGYKQDDYRPHAWRYRDYVIQSFNDDKPYDRFVSEQIAGDEIDPHDPTLRVATSYYRHGVYEYNQRDVRAQHDAIIDDITAVTSDVFIGMGLACAKCHDHKFDPLLQADYFRFRAFFAPLQQRDDLFVADRDEVQRYDASLAAWKAKTQDLRDKIAAVESDARQRAAQSASDKFPPRIRHVLNTAPQQRNPLAVQLAALAQRQIDIEFDKPISESKQTDEYKTLLAQLASLQPPAMPPVAFTATDVGSAAPPTQIPGKSKIIEPGFLSILDPNPIEIAPLLDQASTGRRLALSRWLIDPSNPLTTRVLVNRLWQQHFGTGLVATPSDFGRLGERPSHPQLLDWLATQFMSRGWSIKEMHRILVSSATYRQGTINSTEPSALPIDSANRLLWKMPPRRLRAEQVRDAALQASGELRKQRGGPSTSHAQPRRSIYTKIVRNQPNPLLAAFDGADNHTSTSTRNITTTPTQALLMINGDWMLQRATHLATSFADLKDDAEFVRSVYQAILTRRPTPTELQQSIAFLSDADLSATVPQGDTRVDLCHVLLNSNEFLYVD